jgi:hypothetical protein
MGRGVSVGLSHAKAAVISLQARRRVHVDVTATSFQPPTCQKGNLCTVVKFSVDIRRNVTPKGNLCLLIKLRPVFRYFDPEIVFCRGT